MFRALKARLCANASNVTQKTQRTLKVQDVYLLCHNNVCYIT